VRRGCQYHAIFVGREKVLVFPGLCHSCGGCAIVCPEGAIAEERHRVGTLKSGTVGGVDLVYGELELGEPMAVPVIREVKKRIRKTMDVIIDSPPGASCPVVETTRGSDFCLLVTEPTPFGLHDLKLMVEVLAGMEIPLGVVVNRVGIGDSRVHDFCREKGIPILLEIPYLRRIAELHSKGAPFSEEMPEWKGRFLQLFEDARRLAKK